MIRKTRNAQQETQAPVPCPTLVGDGSWAWLLFFAHVVSTVFLGASLTMAGPFSVYSDQTGGFAEGIYQEYSNASGRTILFEIETLKSGPLADIAHIPLDQLLEVPGHFVRATDKGLHLVDVGFAHSESSRGSFLAAVMDMGLGGYPVKGYPISMGDYRLLQIGVAVGDKVKVHQALELSWSALGYYDVFDPAILHLTSFIRTRARLAAEGWGQKVFQGIPKKLTALQKAGGSCKVLGRSTSSKSKSTDRRDAKLEFLGVKYGTAHLREQSVTLYCRGDSASTCQGLVQPENPESHCHVDQGWHLAVHCHCNKPEVAVGSTQDKKTWGAEVGTKCAWTYTPHTAKSVAIPREDGNQNAHLEWHTNGAVLDNSPDRLTGTCVFDTSSSTCGGCHTG